jgi:ABC-2 type transport system ATP-binding protein
VLSVQQVSKSFGDLHAVSDVSFKVKSGEIVAVIGPNGAGKTTTFRMICGLVKPDRGSIGWGEEAKALPEQREMGFLPEERGLYQDIKVSALLEYWGHLRGLGKHSKDLCDQWLTKFELQSKRNELVRTLSKGNQQKLQVAACLLHDPSLLVLDEPFTGLDPVNQEMISELLRERAASGTAILISAHQLALVEKLADRVLVLQGGRILTGVDLGVEQKLQPDESKIALIVVTKGFDIDALRAHFRRPLEIGLDNIIRVEFKNTPLWEFYGELSQLCRHEGVLDIKVERLSLHETYMSLVRDTHNRSTTHG